MRRLLWAAALGATAATVHSVLNARLLRRPAGAPPPPAGRVAVLLPVRDEADRVGDCLRAVLAQTADVRIVVLDDGSADGTADVVRRVGGDRVELVTGAPLPAGSGRLGKPHACAQAAAHAGDADVLVFVDADVVLAPHAVAACVDLLERHGLDLVSPYPRQVAVTVAERLVQPLLQWSWLTFLPLRAAERSARPSLTAANGQLLAVRRDAYDRAGGHAAVAGEVLEDLALLRAVKRSGGRGVVADGTGLATCRMYTSGAALAEGYTKSLWAAFGSPAGAVAVTAGLIVLYVVPPAAALAGSRAGMVGYLAGVAGRVVTARATGGRAWPDALAHPASVLALVALTARSWRARRRGTLTWKGRTL
ncbi:MAG TPA: glycosyltransferase family 2 protein [Mycobacteriales bacterium]